MHGEERPLNAFSQAMVYSPCFSQHYRLSLTRDLVYTPVLMALARWLFD